MKNCLQSLQYPRVSRLKPTTKRYLQKLKNLQLQIE